MPVFGDPNRFAVMVERVEHWTAPGGHQNGVFHFIVDQAIFPRSMRVATITADVGSLVAMNALVDHPEDERVIGMSPEEAFAELLGNMLPWMVKGEDDIPDDFVTDYTFQASTYNLEDAGCFAFAVASGDQVRILAADTSDLAQNGDGRGRAVSELMVSEVWIGKLELAGIIASVVKAFPPSQRPPGAVV